MGFGVLMWCWGSKQGEMHARQMAYLVFENPLFENSSGSPVALTFLSPTYLLRANLTSLPTPSGPRDFPYGLGGPEGGKSAALK